MIMEIAKKEIPTHPQEYVRDYPRPPRLEPTPKRLEVIFAGKTIASTNEGYRVLETTHPPVYYFPPSDIDSSSLIPNPSTSFCEWKGTATYYNVTVNDRSARKAAWTYRDPTTGYVEIKNYVAFYAGPMDECLVDGERVTPQPGGFYGGWITKDILGTFKN